MIDKMITEKTEEEMKNFTKNMIWFCAGVYSHIIRTRQMA